MLVTFILELYITKYVSFESIFISTRRYIWDKVAEAQLISPFSHPSYEKLLLNSKLLERPVSCMPDPGHTLYSKHCSLKIEKKKKEIQSKCNCTLKMWSARPAPWIEIIYSEIILKVLSFIWRVIYNSLAAYCPCNACDVPNAASKRMHLFKIKLSIFLHEICVVCCQGFLHCVLLYNLSVLIHISTLWLYVHNGLSRERWSTWNCDLLW